MISYQLPTGLSGKNLTITQRHLSLQYILIRPDWHIVYTSNQLSVKHLSHCLEKFFILTA